MPWSASLDSILDDDPEFPSCLVTERVLDRPLPGRAMAAAMVIRGELWVVIDMAKTNALRHARRLLTDPRTIELVKEVEPPTTCT